MNNKTQKNDSVWHQTTSHQVGNVYHENNEKKDKSNSCFWDYL